MASGISCRSAAERSVSPKRMSPCMAVSLVRLVGRHHWKPARDPPPPARRVRDVHGVVLAVGAGHAEEDARPAEPPEPALLRERPPEEQDAGLHVVVLTAHLEDTVHVDLERLGNITW